VVVAKKITNIMGAITREKIIEKINSKEIYIDKLMEEIENLKEELECLCEECGGVGEIIDTTKIHSRIIDVPFTKCYSCGGSGFKI